MMSSLFQSTPPARTAKCGAAAGRLGSVVSIHAARADGDVQPMRSLALPMVSIHAAIQHIAQRPQVSIHAARADGDDPGA